MITIWQAFGMAMIVVTIIIMVVFGGLFLGALIYHRGVSIGSGSRESFTGQVPKGEVFRIGGVDDLPEEPDADPIDKSAMDRANRFLSSVMAKGGLV